jgi:predicted ribosomally synthesized peptide with SipW-like signal peptide
MKKALIWCLLMILVAALSIAGALAYLTATDKEANTMTLGNVAIDILEYERKPDSDTEVKEFGTDRILLPAVLKDSFNYTLGADNIDWGANGVKDGYSSSIWAPNDITNEIDKMVFVKNTGDISAYVRTFFAFEAGNCTTFDQFRDTIHFNLNETDWTWEWDDGIYESGDAKYVIAKATYNKALAKNAVTEISLSQIALDSSVTSADALAFGKEYNVRVFSQGTQSDGFNDPKVALTKAFGNDIPFKNFVLKGVSLKNALHYLIGMETGTQITDKVTSITFGLNTDHAAKVANQKRVYVSDEQTVPVYAYYVPNATDAAKYDIYVLADDKIYTPKDSTGLFYNMSSLQKVDTSKLDVSKTEIMEDLFNGCSKLSDIDVSGWDVSNVTSLNGVFFQCPSLTKLDLSSWDVSKVTDFFVMFCGCKGMTELNLSGWDLRSAEKTTLMFKGCASLNQLYVSDWDVSTITSAQHMFMGCSSLTALDLSGWNTVSLKDTLNMFDSCSSLGTIFVGNGWDVSNVTQSGHMFSGCTALKGSNGTTIAGNPTDKTYARVDGGPENPGYFTYKAAEGNNT